MGASFGRSPMARPLLLSEEDPSSFVYLTYFGDQNIILGTETLFWGQEDYFGDRNIIFGTKQLKAGGLTFVDHDG